MPYLISAYGVFSNHYLSGTSMILRWFRSLGEIYFVLAEFTPQNSSLYARCLFMTESSSYMEWYYDQQAGASTNCLERDTRKFSLRLVEEDELDQRLPHIR